MASCSWNSILQSFYDLACPPIILVSPSPPSWSCMHGMQATHTATDNSFLRNLLDRTLANVESEREEQHTHDMRMLDERSQMKIQIQTFTEEIIRLEAKLARVTAALNVTQGRHPSAPLPAGVLWIHLTRFLVPYAQKHSSFLLNTCCTGHRLCDRTHCPLLRLTFANLLMRIAIARQGFPAYSQRDLH